jgi:hypothetical protein
MLRRMSGSGRMVEMQPSDEETMRNLAEFLVLADRLQMPDSERQGILGISEELWPAVAATRVDSAEVRTEEFRRRLGYILPLMRRAVENGAGSGPDPVPTALHS